MKHRTFRVVGVISDDAPMFGTTVGKVQEAIRREFSRQFTEHDRAAKMRIEKDSDQPPASLQALSYIDRRSGGR